MVVSLLPCIAFALSLCAGRNLAVGDQRLSPSLFT
jgi:hypothetical protein